MAAVAAVGGRVTTALQAPAWDPLTQPTLEPDTVLLADLTSMATINAQGGILAGPSNTAQNPADYAFGAGKFGPAVKPSGNNNARYVFYPLDGLARGDGFTVGFWAMHPTTAWDAIADGTLCKIAGRTFDVPLRFAAGSISTFMSVLPDAPSGTTGKATVSVTQSISGLGLAAGTFHHVMLSHAGSTLKIYLNGALVKTVAGLPLPSQLTDTLSAVGLMVGGHQGSTPGMWISDLRVSRTARTPGVAYTRRSLTGHLAVDTTTSTGDIAPNVLGALHPPWNTGEDAAVIGAAVKLIRTDKLINATPIKAGGTDATHPTLGNSGSYSYDWQVVDRTINEIVRLGCAPYISWDCAPQILGGPAPFSGTDLTTKMSLWANYASTVPNDITAWGHIVADFADHIINDLDVDIPLHSFWNEPDGSSWAGTQAQYFDFWVATANAVRTVDPAAKVGGPELSELGSLYQSWVNGLMARSVADGVPLSFVAYHEYSGDIRSFNNVRAIVDKLAADNGLATPFPLVLGEFNWTNRLMYYKGPPAGPGFFESQILHVRSIGAAYAAAFVANMLQDNAVLGLAYSHINYSTPRDGGFAVTQLIGPNDEKWGTYNAMKGLQLVLGDERLAVTDELPPGVWGYAGKDTATGRIGVVVASFGWANRATRTVHLHLTGMTGTKRLRRYLVDETHSSRWDTFEDDPAGSVDNDLEEMEDRTAAASALRDIELSVPRWSAQFLTVESAA